MVGLTVQIMVPNHSLDPKIASFIIIFHRFGSLMTQESTIRFKKHRNMIYQNDEQKVPNTNMTPVSNYNSAYYATLTNIN